MTTLQLRKSSGRSLLLLLAFLAFPHLLAAYPQLTIPHPGNNIIGGTIYHTDGNGHTLATPVYYIPPVTLLAQGGAPLSGYTWTLATGSTFPQGVTVNPGTGIFYGTGQPLIAGSHTFAMTVSDGATAVTATFAFSVQDDYSSPPAVVP